MTAPTDTLEMESLFLKLSEMEAQWQGLQTNDGTAETAAASPAVQAQTARLQKMIQQKALYSARIKWVPSPFYTHWTATERAHYLETNVPSAVCRSLVLENRKQALDKDPSHPRFILVVWPTVAELDVNKVTKAVQALRRDPQLPCTAFDWQVALPADAQRLTGCPFSDVVSPLCATDSTCHLAVFLSKIVVPHRFFWMDTGIWASKVGLTVSDFTKAVKPYICDLSVPKATRPADLKAAPLDAIPLSIARTDVNLEEERQAQVNRLPTVDNPQYRPLERTQIMKVAMKTTASVRRKQEARKLQAKREEEARHLAAAKSARKASLSPSSRLLQATASSTRRTEEETAAAKASSPVTRKPAVPAGKPPAPRRLVRRDTPSLPLQTVSKVAGKVEVVHATPRRSQPLQPKSKVVTPSSSTRRGGRRGLAAGMEPIVEQQRVEAFADDSTDGGFSSGDDMMLDGLMSDDDDIGALLGDDEDDTEDYEDTNTSGDLDDDLLGDSSHPKPVTERVVNRTVTRVRREIARDFTRRVPNRCLSSAEHPELDPEVLEETTRGAADEPVFLQESSHPERTATDPLQDSTTENEMTASMGEDSGPALPTEGSAEESSQEESTVEGSTLESTTGEAVNPGPIVESPTPEPVVEVLPGDHREDKGLNTTGDTETSFESIDGTMEEGKEGNHEKEQQQDAHSTATETSTVKTGTSNGETIEQANCVETEPETPTASNKSSVTALLGPEVASLKEFDKEKLNAYMDRRRAVEDGSIAPMTDNVEADEGKLESLKSFQMSTDLQAIMARRRQATDQDVAVDN